MMIKLLVAGAIAVPTVTTATVAATGIAWVDVRDGSDRIVVPVPLLLAEVAASFVPKPAVREHRGEAARHLAAAKGVIEALAESPDAEFVRVEDRDEQVVVSKVGDVLHVQVHGNDEEVSVNLPLSAIRQLVRDDGSIDPASAVRAVRHSRFTNLVEVRSRDEHVKVTVW